MAQEKKVILDLRSSNTSLVWRLQKPHVPSESEEMELKIFLKYRYSCYYFVSISSTLLYNCMHNYTAYLKFKLSRMLLSSSS